MREVPALANKRSIHRYGPSPPKAEMMTEDAKFALGF